MLEFCGCWQSSCRLTAKRVAVSEYSEMVRDFSGFPEFVLGGGAATVCFAVGLDRALLLIASRVEKFPAGRKNATSKLWGAWRRLRVCSRYRTLVLRFHSKYGFVS